MATLVGGSYRADQLSLTDYAIGTYTFDIGFTTYEYFSILISAASNWSVILQATNDDVHWYDVTNTLFGVAAMVPGNYIADTYMSFKNLRLSGTVSNIVNKLDLEYIVKKGGGR